MGAQQDQKLKNMEAMALKMLRQERQESIARAKAAIKEQNQIISAIRKALAGEGKTIPELAAAVDMATDVVLKYVATLKRYGIVAEGAKDGDYFKYELIDK